MHLQATQVGRARSLGRCLGRCYAIRLTPSTHRPRQHAFWQHRQICRAAAESEEDSSNQRYEDDFQLRRDVKSVTRTVLEGKPLLQEDRAQVVEEEAKERFFGRLAVLSLGAVLIGERITGRGVVQAVDHAVGVPLWEIEPLLGALVLALIVGAVYPRRKYASKRSQDAAWTTDNVLAEAQVWVRRLACICFAVMIVAEVITGKGALALLDIETGVESLSEVEAGAAFLIMLFLTAAEPRRAA